MYARDLDADVSTGRVSLGWFSPVVVHDIRVDDLAGNRVLTCGRVRCDATLLSLLIDGSSFGRIVVEQPELQLQLWPHGSNVEDVLASYLSDDDTSGSASGIVEIKQGTIQVSVAQDDASAPARFEGIEATVTLKGSSESGGSFELTSCQAVGGGKRPAGALAGKAQWQAEGPATHWSVATNLQSLDLAVLQPLAARWSLNIQWRGTGTVEASLDWNGATGEAGVELKRARIEQLQVSAPQYLGRDQLALSHLAGHGSCQLAGQLWTVSQLQLDSNVGQVTIDGRWQWPRGAGDWQQVWRQWAATSDGGNVSVEGMLDLAQLAQTLPHTLRIRDDSVLESGQIRFALRGTQAQIGERVWSANLETGELVARRGRQRIVWKDPLTLQLQARHSKSAWHVDRLACAASFLKLSGRATPEEGSFTLQGDLQKLADELREFVDLGGWDAGGAVWRNWIGGWIERAN